MAISRDLGYRLASEQTYPTGRVPEQVKFKLQFILNEVLGTTVFFGTMVLLG
ncbi:hypothetical protein C5167_031721 [Papaver somniferum]|uniref:Uncharacterized protein n=1 Tax=Papaver somniferum TaxID=3469 RepID=A0A4Y7K6M8_PAPSO|nr:hypothetical protein C5167_031721 [Papaver somniferum]